MTNHVLAQSEVVRELLNSKLKDEKNAILFGSAVSKNAWEGSDINVMVFTDGKCRSGLTSSATCYLHDDLSKDTPAIVKKVYGDFLVQIEHVPIDAVSKDMIFDWVLGDRLFVSEEIRVSDPRVKEVLAYVKSNRFSDEVVRKRVSWYLNQADYFNGLGCCENATASDGAFNKYMAGTFLGCAHIELNRKSKGSYKKIFRQMGECVTDKEIFRQLTSCMGLEVGKDQLDRSLGLAKQAVQQYLYFYRERRDELAKLLPEGVHVSLKTTLDIMAAGIPQNKGINENYSAGDYAQAFDSLRRATLWLTNILVKLNYHAGSMLQFSPKMYVSGIERLALKPAGLPDFVRSLFANSGDSASSTAELSQMIRNVKEYAEECVR